MKQNLGLGGGRKRGGSVGLGAERCQQLEPEPEPPPTLSSPPIPPQLQAPALRASSARQRDGARPRTMVEEGGGQRGLRRAARGPPPTPNPVAVVSKALWSVERTGKGWGCERAVGVDCSSPEPRCIWLSSLRRCAAGTPPRRPLGAPHGPEAPRTAKGHRVSTVG